MLVTFTCEVYADITYFGDVAQSLLKMMGHSGTVPGAFLAEDVPMALDRLKTALEALKAASAPKPPVKDDREPDDAQGRPVPMAHRALPLLELLAAAAKANCNVMWYRN
ncbi:MAG: DUF1840 domain-containing protein [Gammaproteobacteria bacterium]